MNLTKIVFALIFISFTAILLPFVIEESDLYTEYSLELEPLDTIETVETISIGRDEYFVKGNLDEANIYVNGVLAVEEGVLVDDTASVYSFSDPLYTFTYNPAPYEDVQFTLLFDLDQIGSSQEQFEIQYTDNIYNDYTVLIQLPNQSTSRFISPLIPIVFLVSAMSSVVILIYKRGD